MNLTSRNTKGKPFWIRLIINLAVMCAAGLLIIYLSTFWLDYWTHHGDYITVPDVKGMVYESAQASLDDEGFDVVLQDSVYENGKKPGEVVDQNPSAGSNVKPGRTVYLTINAFSPRTVKVPQLTDISVRQATTTLQGLGITNITIRKVPSEYQDLVLSASCNGKRLLPGMRIAVASEVVLEIGEGYVEEEVPADSLMPSPEVSAGTQMPSAPAHPEPAAPAPVENDFLD